MAAGNSLPAFVLLLLSLLSLLSLSAAILPETILNAADTLSSSGYLSMSLTLQLISTSLVSYDASLTIFAPSDPAFASSGQPSLSLLKFHLSPVAFPLHAFTSLPPGSKIPTLLANHSLTVTSSNGTGVSVNGVKIAGSPLFDDGSVVIFGIERFLDPAFKLSAQECSSKAGGGGEYSFEKATAVLRSKGYSVTASFLDMQLVGLMDRPVLTVFAPVDEEMEGCAGNFRECSSVFLRHVLACRYTWNDLVKLDDGAVMEAYLDGFGITVTRSGDILMLNEVPISLPDMYQNDWLVVHGLRGMLEKPERTERVAAETGSEISEDRFLVGGEF